jgi:Fe-S cluster assembly iron-binding protein IscA
MIKVEIEDINIKVSQAAIDQAQLILSNDHNLKSSVFRLQIDGKGCNGFDYALGFTEVEKDDLKFPLGSTNLFLHLDRFTAFYCKEGILDYICDFSQDIEGFTFINTSEKNYRGKFFKNEEMAPKEVE